MFPVTSLNSFISYDRFLVQSLGFPIIFIYFWKRNVFCLIIKLTWISKFYHLPLRNLKILEVWSKYYAAEYNCSRCSWKKGISSSKRRFVCPVSLALLIKRVCEIDLAYLVYWMICCRKYLVIRCEEKNRHLSLLLLLMNQLRNR